MSDFSLLIISIVSIALILYTIHQFRLYYLKQPFLQNKIYFYYLISLGVLGVFYLLVLIIEHGITIFLVLLFMNICFCVIIVLMNVYSDYLFHNKITFFSYVISILSAGLISAFLIENPMIFVIKHKMEIILYDYSFKAEYQPTDLLFSQVILLLSTCRLFYFGYILTKENRTEYNFSIYLIFIGFFLKFVGFYVGSLLYEIVGDISFIYMILVIMISLSTGFFLRKPFPFVFQNEIIEFLLIYSKNQLISIVRFKDLKEYNEQEMKEFDNTNAIYFKNIPDIIMKSENGPSLSFQLDEKRIIMSIDHDFKVILIVNQILPNYNYLAKWILEELKNIDQNTPIFLIQLRKVIFSIR